MRKASVRGFSARYLFVRGDGNYVYRRAIPAEYQSLAGGRTEFKKSLTTKDIHTAVVRYAEVHSQHEAIFDQFRRGIALSKQPPPDVDTLKAKAKSLGVSYKSATEMAAKPDAAEFMDRYARWSEIGKPDGPEFDALFGTQAERVTLQKVLAFYEEQTRADLIGLSKREADKKRTPVRAAVQRFLDFTKHDPVFTDIDRRIVNEYRSHLVTQVELGALKAASVNKLIMQVRKIISFYISSMGLDITNPFTGVRIKAEENARPANTIPFIKSKWLSGDVFLTLNPEARGALLAMLDTGCGPKEICGIEADEIHLGANIPHIVIRPNGTRKLKTLHRGRTIPLVGQSLKAFLDNPRGFPSYRRPTGADTLSNTLMKYLRANNLLESEKHSIYSLRHLFKDRMRKHRVPEEMQNELMGHKDRSMGSRYGSGYTLDDIKSYLQKLETDWN